MKNLRKLLLFVAFIISITVTILYMNNRTLKNNVTDNNNNTTETNTTLENTSTSNCIVFLGDSITQGFNLNSYFEEDNLLNYGIKNDTIPKVMDRLDDAITLSPKKIFLMIGINDLSISSGINDTMKENYKNLIEAIRNRCPDTKIILESILPVSNEKYEGLNEDIILFNEYIKELSKEYDLTFIDLWSDFIENGNLNSDLSNDGLHPNNNGYEVIKDNIEAYVI